MTLITRAVAEEKRSRLADIKQQIMHLMVSKGDSKQALKRVAELYEEQTELDREIQLYDQSISAKYDKYFDVGGSDFIDIPDTLSDTVIMRLAKRASHTMEIPLGTTFLTLLGGAATAVATNYATQFRTGTRVPAVLHVACEQPPSTGKSGLVSLATTPYMSAMIKHNQRIGAANKEITSADKNAARLPYGFILKTDATSAAIDAELSEMDSGRVVIASSEQAAFQSLFPEAAGYSSNNSLMLNGWMGEYVSGSRTTRKAYSGYIQSSVLLIAQVGSIQRVLSASNQTGLAERFLFASEPASLGSRTHDNGYLNNDDKAQFNLASSGCVDRYSKRVRNDDGKVVAETDIHSLECVHPDHRGYSIIHAKRQELEPLLGKLNKSGELSYLGWLGKLETHVLKIALVLHVFDCLGNSCQVPQIIPSRLIEASIDLVLEIGKHMRKIIQQSGEAGDTAEVDTVLELVRTEHVNNETAKQMLRKRAPFRARGKDAYKAAGARINSMLREGLLVVSADRGTLKIV